MLRLKPRSASRALLVYIWGFFTWVGPALKSRRKLKTWFRCTVVICTCVILIMDEKTAVSMGQACFFAGIVANLVPPSLAFTLFVLVSFTILFGMMIGWAWGCAAMAAGLAARSDILLAQRMEELKTTVYPGFPPELQGQVALFKGFFLDPRTSAVYGAFLFIGSYAFGVLRACVPNMTLVTIFGSAIMTVMCVSGPIYPEANYTLSKMFLIPTAYYEAIALMAVAVIFPESVNHLWLVTLEDVFLKPSRKMLALQCEALAACPSEWESWAKRTARGVEYRHTLVAGVQELEALLGIIDLEFSIGRLGPDDIKQVGGELKSLMFRAAALQSFQIYVNDLNTCEKVEEGIKDHMRGNVPPDRFIMRSRQNREREVKYGHSLDTLFPILGDASAELRAICDEGVTDVGLWFARCNRNRWSEFFSGRDMKKAEEHHRKLVADLACVRRALDDFREVGRLKLTEPFTRFFDPKTGRLVETVDGELKPAEIFAARSLYICFVFIDTLDAFAVGLTTILSLVIKLDTTRPNSRLWVPNGFWNIKKKLLSRNDVASKVAAPLSMGYSTDPTKFSMDETNDGVINTDDEECNEEDELIYERRNPDAVPPTSLIGRCFRSLGCVILFARSPEGVFALRYAVVTLVLWIPAIAPSSAWFYFQYRGIWALIMAQTGIAVYAADQIIDHITRTLGTLLGLLIGMIIWYIAAGNGNGNPYGMTIATTIVISPLIFFMVFGPRPQMIFWTMVTTTLIFTVGFSWVDRHLPQIVNSGVGAEVMWQRALLVIIGFSTSFILMLFPHPQSSRTLVRRTLAATIEELGHLFAGEVEAFLAEEARARRGQFAEKLCGIGLLSPKEKRIRKIAKKVFAVSARLQGLEPLLQTAVFEPKIQGVWPQAKYLELHATLTRLMASLILVVSAFSRLDTKWCSILVQRTPFLNTNLLSDVFCNVSLISHALSGAHPLPPAIPWLRDRIIYHEQFLAQQLAAHVAANRKKLLESDSDDGHKSDGASDSSNSTAIHDNVGIGTAKLDGCTVGFKEFTLPVLMDEKLPAYATAVAALSSVVSLIDDTTAIVRSLCGETTFRGFGVLDTSYLDEERAVASGFAGGFTEKLR